MDQAAGESISEYLAELRCMATHCDIGNFLDQALRDCFVCGLRHQGTQKRLLSESDLTLTKRNRGCPQWGSSRETSFTVQGHKQCASYADSYQHSDQQYGMCTYCGGNNHLAKDCHYKDALCHKCNKPGYLARMCRSKITKVYSPQQFVTDAHSKWPEIIEMKNTTASQTIDEMRKLCASYGLPKQIMDRNLFQRNLQHLPRWHIKSAPYHPATNGSAERLVQTFKKAMRAGEHDGHTHL